MPSATLDTSLFDSIPDAIEAFRNGEFLVVLDDPSRENEADLILPASSATTEKLAFMIRYTSGYLCAPMHEARARHLGLPPLVPSSLSQDPRATAYTVSVDAAHAATTTGISAHDRALTCRVLADQAATAASLRRPGHVLPLAARPGLTRERNGHTEAAVELCRLAGLEEVGVIGEIVEDGEEVPGKAELRGAGMMRGMQCVEFARKWGLKVVTIADLVEYVERTEGKLATTGAVKTATSAAAAAGSVPAANGAKVGNGIHA